MSFTTNLSLITEAIASLLLITGAVFTLVGAIGLIRLPDFLMRLHAPTKATTLGIGAILIALLIDGAAHGEWRLGLLAITLFLFVTAPVSAAALAELAIARRLPSRAPFPAEPAPAASAATPPTGRAPHR